MHSLNDFLHRLGETVISTCLKVYYLISGLFWIRIIRLRRIKYFYVFYELSQSNPLRRGGYLL